MSMKLRDLSSRGVSYLEESVLLVLQEARRNDEQLGPQKIGSRAGIPEVPQKHQELVTAILHYLERQDKVCNCYRGVWQLADHIHETDGHYESQRQAQF